FGSYMSVGGGGGAQILNIDTSTSASGYVQGGLGGQDAVGGNLANARGNTGGYAMFNGNWGMLSGGGAASPFDGGAPYKGVNNPGVAGIRGSGGSGSCSSHPTNSFAGGAGGNAFCEIWEYE
ncbi:hypothetical protein DBR18_21185, partial [Pseudomonas sp. HMWF021]